MIAQMKLAGIPISDEDMRVLTALMHKAEFHRAAEAIEVALEAG
jgi:hypothetical protein